MNAEGKVVNEISSLERSDGDCIRKGAWSPQEDSILVHYISTHGEGRWTHLARDSGLRRTGKSCRLRWRNYLQPNIRRGNITLQEQLRIMELHCIYGNRWSKIAKFLPGRTDNEIKNYWRTRVHKQAKQLKYDINSIEFNELVRNVWVPRLSEQVQLEASRCNGIDDKIVKNYDDGACTEGFEALQMIDQCVGCSGDHAVELVAPQQDLTTDLFESKLGQNWHHSPFVDDGFKGEEGLANEFSYSELWDVQLNDNNFWTCP